MGMKKAPQQLSYAEKVPALLVSVGLVFLIPALVGFVLVKYFSFPLLPVFLTAFVVSWGGVYLLYQKIHRELQKREEEIKQN